MSTRRSLPIAELSAALIIPWSGTLTILRLNNELPIERMIRFSSNMNHIRIRYFILQDLRNMRIDRLDFSVSMHYTFCSSVHIGSVLRLSQSRKTKTRRPLSFMHPWTVSWRPYSDPNSKSLQPYCSNCWLRANSNLHSCLLTNKLVHHNL